MLGVAGAPNFFWRSALFLGAGSHYMVYKVLIAVWPPKTFAWPGCVPVAPHHPPELFALPGITLPLGQSQRGGTRGHFILNGPQQANRGNRLVPSHRFTPLFCGERGFWSFSPQTFQTRYALLSALLVLLSGPAAPGGSIPLRLFHSCEPFLENNFIYGTKE